MTGVWDEVRYAVRTLAKAPGFVAAAVLTLALGIGTSVAIFSVVYGVLLRPLPYRDADRLVLIEAYREYSGRPATRSNYSLADLDDWRERSRSFEALAFYGVNIYRLSGDEGSEAINAAVVSDEFFATLGGLIILGRPLAPNDDTSPTAVISQRLWQRRFGGAEDVIGQPIVLDSQPYTIVGVADGSLQCPKSNTDVWMPAGFRQILSGRAPRRGQGGFNPLARLKPGVTIAEAQADVEELSGALARDYPDVFTNVRATVVGMRTRLVADARDALLMLLAAVGLVLVVACANVAGLLMIRRLARSREIAIRAALGASRGRLLVVPLLEGALVSMAACAGGVLLAKVSVAALVRLNPSVLPRLDAVRVDTPVLIFATVVAAVTACAVGLVPARGVSRATEALRSGVVSTKRISRLRGALVVTQVAISVVLLVGTALLGRSLVSLLQVDVGVASDCVVAILMDLSADRAFLSDRHAALADRLVERVGAMPDVEIAAVGAAVPPNRPRFRVSFDLADPSTGRTNQYLVEQVPMTPGFLSMLRVPLIRGRWFSSLDNAASQPVMILSRETTRRFFGDKDPIGRTLPIGPSTADGQRSAVTVVGVVGDVRYVGLEQVPGNTIYVPFAQWPIRSGFLIARTVGDPEDAIPAIRREIGAVDPTISIFSARTLDGLLAASTAPWRFRTLLLSAFSGLALALAAVGLYGVLAYSVSQRTSELGIRMALGADRASVVRLVLGGGLRLAAFGALVGIGGAYVFAHMAETLLYAVAPTDLASFVLACGFLLLVSLAASYLPARRAARVDPILALRWE